MIKQKVYLLPENLDQLSNLNMGLALVLLLLIEISVPVNCSLKPDFICCNSSVATGT